MLATARARSPTHGAPKAALRKAGDPEEPLRPAPAHSYSRWTPGLRPETGPNVTDRPVIQTPVVLLGIRVVALVSLTGLIGAREGQPA